MDIIIIVLTNDNGFGLVIVFYRVPLHFSREKFKDIATSCTRGGSDWVSEGISPQKCLLSIGMDCPGAWWNHLSGVFKESLGMECSAMV